jgi:hypothetical protein
MLASLNYQWKGWEAGETHNFQLRRRTRNSRISQHSPKIVTNDIIPTQHCKNSHTDIQQHPLPRTLRLNRLYHRKSLVILTLEFQRIDDLPVLRKNDLYRHDRRLNMLMRWIREPRRDDPCVRASGEILGWRVGWRDRGHWRILALRRGASRPRY